MTPRASFVSPRPSTVQHWGYSWNKNTLLSVVKCFVLPPNSKTEKTEKKITWICARPDHVRVECSSFRFPRELASFVRSRESMDFDPWHVTRSPPTRKTVWVGIFPKGKIKFYLLQTYNMLNISRGSKSHCFPGVSH